MTTEGGAEPVTTTDNTPPISYIEWSKMQKQPETKEESMALAEEMARIKSQDPAIANAPISMTYVSTTMDSSELAQTEQRGSVVLPIPPSNQKWALLQVAGPLYAIHRDTCSFRCLGVFPSLARLQKHKKMLIKRFGDAITGKLFEKEMNKPWLFGFDPVVDPSHPDHEKTLNNILSAHKTYRQQKRREFDQYSADRRTNRKGLQQEEFQRFSNRVETDAKIEEAVRKADEKAETEIKAGGNEPPEISPAEAVRNQGHFTFYCVCHPNDLRKPGPVGQWVACILGAHIDDSDAFDYISDSLQHHFTPKGIKCHAHEMYEWVNIEKPRTLSMSALRCRTAFRTQRHQDLYTGRAQSRAFSQEIMRQQEANGIKRAKNPFAKTHPETRNGNDPEGTEDLPPAMQAYQRAHHTAALLNGTTAKEQSDDEPEPESETEAGRRALKDALARMEASVQADAERT